MRSTRVSGHQQREEQVKQAAAILGIAHATLMKRHGPARAPMLCDFLLKRWAQDVLVSQNVTTRRTTKSHVA